MKKACKNLPELSSLRRQESSGLKQPDPCLRRDDTIYYFLVPWRSKKYENTIPAIQTEGLDIMANQRTIKAEIKRKENQIDINFTKKIDQRTIKGKSLVSPAHNAKNAGL